MVIELVVNNGAVVEPGIVEKLREKFSRKKEARITLDCQALCDLVATHFFQTSKFLGQYNQAAIEGFGIDEEITIVFRMKEES